MDVDAAGSGASGACRSIPAGARDCPPPRRPTTIAHGAAGRSAGAWPQVARGEPISEFDRRGAAGARLQEVKRILAARGWESDADRRAVLRELLTEQLRHAYLWSYSLHRSRGRAVERTRRAMLHAAHSLGRIPEGCSFGGWLFLTLINEGAAPQSGEAKRAAATPLTSGGVSFGGEGTSVCPEPARVIAMLDSPEETGAADADLLRHVEGCRACVGLQNEYRTYRSDGWDTALIERSAWSAAEQDLVRFMSGYFGEIHPGAPSAKAPMAQRLPLMRMSPARALAGSVLLLGAICVALLFGQQITSRLPVPWVHTSKHNPQGAAPNLPVGNPAGQASDPSRPARPTGAERPLLHFGGATAGVDAGNLRFEWDALGNADRYRIYLFTARLDTLFTSPPVSGTNFVLPVRLVPALDPARDYLFKVDAMMSDQVVGTTGFVPYTGR